MKKFFLITTIPASLNFFKGQINELTNYFDVTLISSSDESFGKIAQSEIANFHEIEMKREIAIKEDIVSLVNFIKYFYHEKPSVIHCNTPKASLLGLTAGFLTRVPVRIYYIHGLRYEGTIGKKRHLLKVLEKLNCFCATHIIAVSYGVKQKVEKNLTNKDVTIIHHGSSNGISPEEYSSLSYNTKKIRHEYGIQETDFVFGFVGRLVRDKGINELVNAFNLLEQKKIKLLLVGPYEHELDPLSQETLEIIKTNSNIIVVGYQSDVKKFLSIMDLFVSPSYREGFGLAVLEANFMKIPVLVSEITGHTEIVKEGVNGFFVKPRSTSELFKSMKTLMESKKKLSEMKQDCYNEVVSRYNRKDITDQALLYYKNFK